MKRIFSRLFAFVLISTACFASSEFPGRPGSDPWQNRPNDPDYEDAWHIFSHVPPNHLGRLSPEETEMGSGMSVDKAWQLHTGRPETLIALVDSGVYWDSVDIRDRIYLNTAELPLPEGSNAYDRNGDGRVSINDYEHDARVGDRNGNQVIDVEDLILAFSNGKDEDGNGFVDDISGWDFHEKDNNPGDRIEFGHGTGEAKDSVGMINNSYGSAGACPNCSVVFLRANDSFIVDGNAFAASVHYGVDRGAKVIQEALGSLNYSPVMQEAVNYAWKNNAIIIGSAADENSYHHNYPATLDPVIYVNAIRYNTIKKEEATSFLAFNNCSNFGARVDVAASGIACSSEATGNLSGIAALAASYASSLGKPLTAGELSSLIKSTANDINLGSNEQEPDRHSTWKGWDRITGYGRVNAFHILKSIQEEKIPPNARIVGPKWFELVRTERDRKIPVIIETGLPRSGKIRARLEVTHGVDTAASKWLTIKDSAEGSKNLDGLFAEVNSRSLLTLSRNTLDGPEYKNAYTFRLTVDNLNGQTAEARRTIYLFDSPALSTGFPVDMGASGESSGLFLDLNQDGSEEYVTADSAGWLHAIKADGTELSGFPVQASGLSAYSRSPMTQHTGPFYSTVYAPIAAADLDGDGSAEIVVASLEGDVSVIHVDGRLAEGSPFKLPFPDMTQARKTQQISQGIFAAPVLADMDRDGKKEIIITAADGNIYVFNIAGRIQTGFPVAVTQDGVLAKLMSSPAVYDVNADGTLDFVLGTNHTGKDAGFLYAISGLGTRAASSVLTGFPLKIPLIKDDLLPTVGTGIPASPVIADLDGDGIKEILVHGFVGKPYLVSMDGGLKKSLSMEIPAGSPVRETSFVTGFGQPSIADVDGFGKVSPVILGSSNRILVSMANGGKRIPYDSMLGVWSGSTGILKSGFPRVLDDIPLLTSAVSADLDGDGKDEVIAGTGGYFLRAFTSSGEAEGFPAFTGGWVLGTPSVGDSNGDFKPEVGVSTREGYIFHWKTVGTPRQQKSTWPTFKGNNARTGVQGESK